MRILSFLILLLLTGTVAAQVDNPFLQIKTDSLVMYDFVGGKGGDLSIVKDDGTLANAISKSVTLDKNVSLELMHKLGSKKSYGQSVAACFDPHLGFVFYNKGKIVAHVTICTGCNRLISSIDLKAQKQGETISGNDNYYTGQGMSKSFRIFLNTLLKKHKFSHQIETERLSF